MTKKAYKEIAQSLNHTAIKCSNNYRGLQTLENIVVDLITTFKAQNPKFLSQKFVEMVYHNTWLQEKHPKKYKE